MEDFRVFSSGEESLSEVGFEGFGLISTIVIKRAQFLAASECIGNSIPNGFDFLCIVPMVMKSGPVVYMNKPTVKFRHYEKRWSTDDNYSQAMEIYFVVIPTVLRHLKARYGYQKSVINRIHFLHLANFTLQLAVAKSKGWKPSRKNLVELLTANSWHWLLLAQIPLMMFPASTLNGLTHLYTSNFADYVRKLAR